MLVRVDKSWNAGLAFCRFQEKLSFCKSWKELSVTSHLLCDQSFKIYFSRMLMLIFSVKTTSSVGRCLSPHQTLAVIFYQLKIRWRREDLASFFFFFHCWQTSSRTWPANTVAFDCYGCYVSYYVILLSCNVKIPVSCFFFVVSGRWWCWNVCVILSFNVHIHVFVYCLACSLKTLCTS